MSATLELSEVVAGYGATPAVQGVSLKIESGGLIGLIGPNGAGKSTLLKICAGLLAPMAGAVTLNGHALAAWSPAHRARVVGYLPQTRTVVWPVSVARLVALGRLPHLTPWQKLGAQDATEVSRALDETDTAALTDRQATALSGGELARVLIARLLAGTPDVLLADEPIAGLDPAHTLQVMTLFRQLAEAGRTVVVVLHDLNVAARYCARLLLLDNGRCVADGPPAAVLTPDILARHYHVKAEVVSRAGELLVVPVSLTPASAQSRGSAESA